jgi:hypothetical protein
MFALAALLAALAALAYLLLGAPPWRPAGGPAGAFAIDGLSAYMLLGFVPTFAVPRRWPALAGLLGGLLVLFAGHSLTLLLGAALVAAGRSRLRAAAPALLLVLALALLGGGGFAAIRAAPPGTMRATAALLAGLVAAPGLGAPLGIYLVLRLGLDLAGPLPPWCGLLPLAAGAGLALCGGRAALRGAAMTGFARMLLGLAMIGAGLALSARGEDLAPLGAQALAAGFLAALGGMCLPLLEARPALRIAGAATLALVPPGLGFAACWTLLRVLQSAPAPGAAWIGVPLHALAAAALAVTMALAAGAVVRLVRHAFAAPAEPPGPRIWLALPAALAGIVPELPLHLAAPAASGLIGVPAALAPGYLPWGVTAMAVAAAAAMLGFRRRLAMRGLRLGLPWMDGAAAPLPMLPAPVPAPPAWRWPRRLPPLRRLRRGARVRLPLAVLVVALLAALGLVAWVAR